MLLNAAMSVLANITIMITACYFINKLVPNIRHYTFTLDRKIGLLLIATAANYAIMYFAIDLPDGVRIDLRFVVIILLAYHIGPAAAISCAFLTGLLQFSFGVNPVSFQSLIFILTLVCILSIIVQKIRGKYSQLFVLLILNLVSVSLSLINFLLFYGLHSRVIWIPVFTAVVSSLALVLLNFIISDMEHGRRLELQEREYAYTDFLTGLFNVRAFSQKLHELVEDEATTNLTCLIIDIDHFKRINDTYGHTIGDEVLKEIAHTLMKISPNYQHIFRVGGEEFCILLPNSTKEVAKQLGEALRAAVEKKQMDVGLKEPIQVTISVGIASCNGVRDMMPQLYQLADKALYQAKQSGRNQVIQF
ncbi:GGDEF domain-containing protein [Listeria costaricensis]|uniref:GGDEF domain-containing protein n=1 Tax=Listeria costaricensis TaxID=2026604 RepID=UPI000C0710FC|nr:GGDEF domain-containing protein [Listeria costaricensis]